MPTHYTNSQLLCQLRATIGSITGSLPASVTEHISVASIGKHIWVAGIAEYTKMASATEHFGAAGVAKQQTTMAGVVRTFGHVASTTHYMAQIQVFEDTPELASIPMNKVRQVPAVGENLPLVNMGACSSETNEPCLPELSGTTVLTRLAGALEPPDLPAWLEPLVLP